jgi:hypothetical protein
MAMVDYGAIAWKDGKLISTDMFTPMEDMVGWSDENEDKEFKLNGNCFTYIGDEDFTVGFYKNTMRIYCPDSEIEDEMIYFGSNPFEGWRCWRRWYFVNSMDDSAEIIVRPRRFHDYYICKMKYRGHKYKVAFGYGVDFKYYKKTHIIDYYGTPWFRIGSLCRDMKYKFEDWKWSKGL